MKKYLAVAGVAAMLGLVAGCGANAPTTPNNAGGTATTDSGQPAAPTVPVNDTKDMVFSDPNTKVSFHYLGYLQPTNVKSAPGAVSLTLAKRPGSTAGLIGDVMFSTKTHDAWLAEMAAAKAKPTGAVCDSEGQAGCEKWDQDYALYTKAVRSNDFSGYYAMGGSKIIINGITYVVTVAYNIDHQQYQTTYTAYTNNTRITFVDPAAGGVEYGIPFSMNAKNRELVEAVAKNLATRQKVADIQDRARSDELYNLVASVRIAN